MESSLTLLTFDELAWLATLELDEIVQVQQFKEALTNDVFLLTDAKQQQTIFKRLNLKARSRQDRTKELAVQKLVSGYGLAPKVLADCIEYRLQEYIPGETLQSCVVDKYRIRDLAAQLYTIHQLPAHHAPSQRLVFELQLLKKQLKQPIDNEEFERFLQQAIQLDNSSPRDILCHGDLSFNNILRTSKGHTKFLDWEYAVLACSAYDIAFCSCINQFTLAQQAQLIKDYYLLNKHSQTGPLAQLEKDCVQYFSLFSYINRLWACCFLDN